MTIPVTRTKIILPRRRNELVTRSRLIDLLYDLLDHKLIIVAAPAGYGKTSLLVDFAHQSNLPTCWYALDPFDNDLHRFVAHFIASMVQVFPAFGNRSIGELESAYQGRVNIPSLVASLVNELFEHVHEHFLLVLDDYHLVSENKEIEDFIDQFIQAVDENCHLVLSSRALFNLPDMPVLVSRSLVGGLSFEELSFQPEEIQAFALKNHKLQLSEAAARELATETEGWITGLILSTQSMWQAIPERLRIARLSGVGLYEFLAQQVLDLQPAEIREFLLRTSLLEEFDAELCQSIFGDDQDWINLIDVSVHSNLFILPVGEDGRWLRYHHLFRDFLQNRFALENPEEREALLRRIGGIYAQRGEWEKAYGTYLMLGDQFELAGLIELAGSTLVKSGRLVTLADWLDAIPADVFTQRPNLVSLRGVTAVMQGQFEEGLALLNEAEAALQSQVHRHDLARTLVRRSDAHRLVGRYQASLEDASAALAFTENDASLGEVRAGALRAKGMSLYQLGRVQESLDWLTRAMEAATQLDDRQITAIVQMELGVAAMSSGRFRLAMKYFQEAINYWRESGNTLRQANLLNNLGVLYHLTGEYEQAIRLFEEALGLARRVNYGRMQAYLLCSIGDLYADLQAGEAALEAYQQGGYIAAEIDYPFLRFFALVAQAAQFGKQGKFSQAHGCLTSASQISQESGSHFDLGYWHLVYGKLHLTEDNPQKAVEMLAEAARQFDEGGQKVEAARANLFLAMAYFYLGDKDESLTALGEAFARAGELESDHILVVTSLEVSPVLRLGMDDELLGKQASELMVRTREFENKIPYLRRRLRSQTYAIPFSPPKISIHALGNAQVELDGSPVATPEWQNQKKVRELFYFLLAESSGLTKEAIGVEIWPDSSQAQLKLQFKNSIYRLRYALGQDIIAFDENRYWFNRELDYAYDVEMFLGEITRGQAALRVEERQSAYRAAIQFYSGAYLPEIGSTWVVSIRENLAQKYIHTLLNLAQSYLEKGDNSASLEVSHRVLLEDGSLEEAHRLAMLAYAAKGDRAGLTRQYERCRQTLLEEFKIEPSPQTIELYQLLRR